MKLLASISLVLLCAVGVHAAERVSPVDDIATAAKSNDWTRAKQVYDKVDWRKAPAAELKQTSEALSNNPSAATLRQIIVDQYERSRKPGDPDLADPIARTELVVEEIPVSKLTVTSVPVELVPMDDASLAALKLWEARYSKLPDYYDDAGRRIIPARGTVLWAERQAVIRAVEAGGDFEALWGAYNNHLQAAVGRRVNLRKKQNNEPRN
ncbi:MAG: hypothetical protein PHW60_16500 [Kiritimatiellae bacterium]|nr:hypothetical protein [Kiritimatiellia bacterium]